jgi:HEPN domain-containing protein
MIYLVKKCELELPENYLDFIGKINTASIPTRYPDDLQRSLKEYPESVATDYLIQATELIKWLQQHPNLSK